MHLHSANSSQSYIPQQILDQKALELTKRKEISDQINVSLSSLRRTSAEYTHSCRQTVIYSYFDSNSTHTVVDALITTVAVSQFAAESLKHTSSEEP